MKATKLIFKTFLSSAFKAGVLSSLMIAQVHFAYAQTASILPPAKTTFLDQNGKPLTGGTVKFYIPGTTTPKTTWQDSGETVPNTNPVVLDSAGRGIILGDGSYRQQVYDKKGNLIWDQQTASGGGSGGGGTATVGDGNLVGTIKPWAGFVAPTQYVFAYGQELARASFPLLLSTITTQQNVGCTSGNSTLTGLSDTSQIPIGAPIESICLNAGATVVSTTISTIVASSNAIITTNSSARIFPFGNGDGSLTFNAPDLRGRVLAGRDNMGGVAASRLTNAATGFGATAALGATGGSQSQTLALAQLPTGITSANVTPWNVIGASNNALSFMTANSQSASFSANAGSQVWQAQAQAAVVLTQAATASGSVTSNNTGGTAHPIVQPTGIVNYIIKTLPDSNANTFFGVASIGGMFGVLTCGTGLTCAGNQISAISSVVPTPLPSTLGGVFSLTCSSSNWFKSLDTTGAFGCSQPNFTDLAGSIAAGQVPNNLISNAMIRQSGALTLIGRSANSTGNVADISAAAASGCVFEETGSTLACSTVATAGIANSAVTGAKIATNTVANSNIVQSAAATLKGNPTNATANASDFTIQGLTARGAPDATNDKIPLYDNAAGTIKYVTPGQVASSATAGVSSIAGNTGAFTLANGIDNSTNQIQLTAARRTIPTTQSLTTGTGATYTTPANCLWIEVFMVGGGGGGAGVSNGTGGASVAGSDGTASTFNSVNANPGKGATGTGTITQGSIGGAGGSGGTGTATRRGRGGPGGGGLSVIAANPVGYTQGGHGGNSYFAGGAQVASGITTATGTAGDANSGAGGSGSTGLANSNAAIGGGGGAGEFVYSLIAGPSATYTYTIGPGGAGGVGTSSTGGAGGTGFIFVIEHYGS